MGRGNRRSCGCSVSACALGYEIVVCRDPGSTELGERIREVLLSREASTAIARRSEMFLYMAARAQLVEEVIQPALAEGKTVVSDRYVLANIVYQGHAGGLDVADVRHVGQVATGGITPDCIFLLDMKVEEADRRMSRALDRMESQGPEYRRRLREGFLAEAARSSGKIHVIDASLSIDEVQAEIWHIASEKLGLLSQ